MDELVAVDPAKRTVRTAEGAVISGDYLVLATGSRVNFYGIPGADRHTFPLYSLTDAEKLRSAGGAQPESRWRVP
jgi:NADH dehydrogenase